MSTYTVIAFNGDDGEPSTAETFTTEHDARAHAHKLVREGGTAHVVDIYAGYRHVASYESRARFVAMMGRAS